jgi:MFS family permease
MEKMNKTTAKKQIRKLLFIDAVSGCAIGGAAWVALLAARGFSTVEIGLLESIFHVTSMIFEVPSGVVADMFGRRKTMVASRVMMILSSICMIVSRDFYTVAIAISISALSYNLASGTREALAYDSLKEAGMEKEYDAFASNDLMIYQMFSSAGTLLAGVALWLGYRRANLVDAVVGVVTLVIALSLKEVHTKLQENMHPFGRLKQVVGESLAFLAGNRRARQLILFNSLVGAVDVLVLFFLQAKLPAVGLNPLWLGPALFAMGIGAAAGAKATEYVPVRSYRKIALVAALGTALSFTAVLTGNVYLMIPGGFLGAFCDNFLEVKTDVRLNHMIPSEQRATLMSVNSFSFSIVMIVLSPVFGYLFS